MFGSLFLAFDEANRLWFVGPITFRRTLLQFLAAVLNKSEYARAMAICSIAIHTLYGLSVGIVQPYTDDQASLGIGDLNRLAVFHSSVQVLILIIGLCSERPQKASNGDAARDGNGDAIAAVSFIVVAIATIVTTFEIIRIHNKNKNNGDDANAAYAIELTAADHAFATDSSLSLPVEGLSFFLSDAAKETLAKEEAAAPQPGGGAEMPPGTCPMKEWLDAAFHEWDEDLRVEMTASLLAEDLQDPDELMDLKEEDIAAVVADLPKRRARQFREAIDTLKQGAGSGAGAR